MLRYNGKCVPCFEEGMQERINARIEDKSALFHEIMGFLGIDREEYHKQIYADREAIVACRNLLRSLDLDLAKDEAEFIDIILKKNPLPPPTYYRGAFC